MPISLAVLVFITGCSGAPSSTPPRNVVSATAVPLPTLVSTASENGALPSPTVTETPLTLQTLFESRGLILWQPEIEPENPITPSTLSNRVTYGAMLDELEVQLDQAEKVVSALETDGVEVEIEVRWNGVSSYVSNTEVEVFYRDKFAPRTSLWVEDSENSFTLYDVSELSSLSEIFPNESPFEWRSPGNLIYLDDPQDGFARGMQVLDAEGNAIALWDPTILSFRPWIEVGPFRHRLVNGFEIDFYGFSEEELDLLWEAFSWISLGMEEAPQFFDPVVSVRSTTLPLWVAGIADRGDIRLDPFSFQAMRLLQGAPRQADVIWIAGLLVHETAHVNQTGECTPSYAVTQGMTLEAYGLFRETGPGQAYQQEVEFLVNVLNLKTENGKFVLSALEIRKTIQEHTDFTRDALGQSVFPNGDPVPTCADALPLG